MNKFYVIFPVVLLLTFGVYYTQVAKPEMAEQERREAKKIEAQQAADDARRKEIEAKAQADAQAQQQIREEKERLKQEKAQKDREEQDRNILAETAKYETLAASLSKQISDLDKEIADLRDKRENLTRDVFDSAAKVELAKIERRNAELEIQRLYDIVAQKVGDSFLAKIPPPPQPK